MVDRHHCLHFAQLESANPKKGYMIFISTEFQNQRNADLKKHNWYAMNKPNPRLVSVGALNLDIIGNISALHSHQGKDVQYFADWIFEPGGTATNIALCSADFGVDTLLIAILGKDPLSIASQDILQNKNIPRLSILPTFIDGTNASLVALIYSTFSNGSVTRQSYGPIRSALDAISAPQLESLMNNVKSNDIVIFDGYLMFRQENIFSLSVERAKNHNAMVCLELVPHEIWRWRDHNALINEISDFDHVSASLPTIERIYLDYLNENDKIEIRIHKLLDKIHKHSPNTIFHLRYGKRDCEGVYLVKPGAGMIDHRPYRIDPQTALRATGDKLFVSELLEITVNE